MLRSTLSKVMWVGRAAVFVVGLCVIVALVLGVATMAFAGNGEPWVLGQLNSATNITKLAGDVDGPMLRLTNDDSGSDDTALDLNVQSGEPPMTIDSQQKVTDLNADRLDGQSSGAFASYERTVIVSPVGTNTQNGQALLDALASIKDASESKPYLLYIEPETYALGTQTLKMKPWVDIEGSGELNTVITSASPDESTGTVQGADNAELRFLTVRRIRSARGFGQDFFAAIANFSASPRLTHVTARTTGREVGRSIGVNNDPGSNPTMTDVTAAASEGGTNIGVNNDPNSSPTMTDVTATASRGNTNVGVANFPNSSPTMTDVTATASGGSVTNIGVQIQGADVTIRQSKLSGSGPDSHALRKGSGSAKVALSQLVGRVTNLDRPGTLRCFNNYDENMAAVSCP